MQVGLYERKSDGSLVVIKSCSSSAELHREVDSYCRLGCHPLLVPLLDVFEEGGRLHLVMKHCSRGDMRTWFETVKVSESLEWSLEVPGGGARPKGEGKQG